MGPRAVRPQTAELVAVRIIAAPCVALRKQDRRGSAVGNRGGDAGLTLHVLVVVSRFRFAKHLVVRAVIAKVPSPGPRLAIAAAASVGWTSERRNGRVPRKGPGVTVVQLRVRIALGRPEQVILLEVRQHEK